MNETLRELLVSWVRGADEYALWAFLGAGLATKAVGAFFIVRGVCGWCGAKLKGTPEHPAVAKALAMLPAARMGESGPITALGNDEATVSIVQGDALGSIVVAGSSVRDLLEPRERERVRKAALAEIAKRRKAIAAAQADADRKAAAALEAERLEQRAALARRLTDPAPQPVACGPSRALGVLDCQCSVCRCDPKCDCGPAGCGKAARK